MKIRPERVAHRMRREIADILANRMRDPRMSSWVSVTDVEITGDLAFARVYVSVLPEGAERDEALRVLGGAAGFVRRELAARLGLREVPEIRFQLDTSIEHGARVDEILRRLGRGEPVGDDADDAPER
jgi:ribosome-binding factor A